MATSTPGPSNVTPEMLAALLAAQVAAASNSGSSTSAASAPVKSDGVVLYQRSANYPVGEAFPLTPEGKAPNGQFTLHQYMGAQWFMKMRLLPEGSRRADEKAVEECRMLLSSSFYLESTVLTLDQLIELLSTVDVDLGALRSGLLDARTTLANVHDALTGKAAIIRSRFETDSPLTRALIDNDWRQRVRATPSLGNAGADRMVQEMSTLYGSSLLTAVTKAQAGMLANKALGIKGKGPTEYEGPAGRSEGSSRGRGRGRGGGRGRFDKEAESKAPRGSAGPAEGH